MYDSFVFPFPDALVRDCINMMITGLEVLNFFFAGWPGAAAVSED